jgi:hypothetical protein
MAGWQIYLLSGALDAARYFFCASDFLRERFSTENYFIVRWQFV